MPLVLSRHLRLVAPVPCRARAPVEREACKRPGEGTSQDELDYNYDLDYMFPPLDE